MSFIQLSASTADYSTALSLAQRGYVFSSPEQAQALGLTRTSPAVNFIASPSSASFAFATAPAQAAYLAPAQAAPVVALSPAPVAAPRLCPCGCGYEIRASPAVFAEQAPLAVEAAPVVASPVGFAEANFAPALAAFVDTPPQGLVAPTAIVAAAPEAVLAVEPAPAAAPCPLKSLPPLPPVNASCYAPPVVEPGLVTAKQVQLPTEERVLETNDADVQTVVRENNSYTTFNQTVVTTVNRNHLHTQRVITNENQFNTHVTNNVVKVNDIHRQQIERIAGETRVNNDFKETTTVEQPKCLNASGNALVPCGRY